MKTQSLNPSWKKWKVITFYVRKEPKNITKNTMLRFKFSTYPLKDFQEALTKGVNDSFSFRLIHTVYAFHLTAVNNCGRKIFLYSSFLE
jgi:hypothetical protein